MPGAAVPAKLTTRPRRAPLFDSALAVGTARVLAARLAFRLQRLWQSPPLAGAVRTNTCTEDQLMNLIRRDPFEMTLPRFFNQFLGEPFDGGALSQLEEGTLPLDIAEDEKNVIVRASVPGFRKEDIDVEVH